MRVKKVKSHWIPLFLVGIAIISCAQAEERTVSRVADPAPFGPARKVGFFQDKRLTECSGLDASPINPDLFWAVNDGGNGPYLYALGGDGRSRGRVRVAGARNRDWEGLATFVHEGRSMILIADFGDNRERHDTHILYGIEEPPLIGEEYPESATVKPAWRTLFSYPDGNHDAEAIAVDSAGESVLILTKRDAPPLLFEVDLKSIPPDAPVTARKIAEVDRIPPPSLTDLAQKYGLVYSHPTGMDLSSDGRRAVVLTYKHAYLFSRGREETWATAFSGKPIQVPLPHPRDHVDFRQREAICFTLDGNALMVTSEGKNAGMYRLNSPQ